MTIYSGFFSHLSVCCSASPVCVEFHQLLDHQLPGHFRLAVKQWLCGVVFVGDLLPCLLVRTIRLLQPLLLKCLLFSLCRFLLLLLGLTFVSFVLSAKLVFMIKVFKKNTLIFDQKHSFFIRGYRSTRRNKVQKKISLEELNKF